jgi:hypothetical protein
MMMLCGIEVALEDPSIYYPPRILAKIERLCTLVELHPWTVMMKDTVSLESYWDLYNSMGSIAEESDEETSQESSDNETWEPRRGYYSKAVIRLLQSWFRKHIDYPYPSDEEKARLCAETQLTHSQISQWFINARRRYSNKHHP